MLAPDIAGSSSARGRPVLSKHVLVACALVCFNRLEGRALVDHWRAVRPAAALDSAGEGRSHSDAWVGCIVWSTTASSSPWSVSRSSWSRRWVLKAWIVSAASWRRRLKRRSTAWWCTGLLEAEERLDKRERRRNE
jgi:hypothetical protein